MTGNAVFTYKQNDLIALIKADIMAKFGQRELQGIDINCPDIYSCEAVYTPECVLPEITVTSTAELVQETVPQFTKEQPYRKKDSVFAIKRDSKEIELMVSYERKEHGSKIRIAGGKVPAKILRTAKAPDNSAGERGHWIPLALRPPENANRLTDRTGVIPYTLNYIPKGVLVTPTTAARNYIIIWLDAAYQSAHIEINWSSALAPEMIDVDMLEVKLEDEDFPRKGSIPAEPHVSIRVPEIEPVCRCTSDPSSHACIQITCDLNKGK